MPVCAKIIGIDLAPIKAIPNVSTIVGDITSAKSKAEIKKLLNGANCEM
jgi:23S rRNA U2552 (ribose-2'-O)-methylase RlmE/FtsJ